MATKTFCDICGSECGIPDNSVAAFWVAGADRRSYSFDVCYGCMDISSGSSAFDPDGCMLRGSVDDYIDELATKLMALLKEEAV